MTDLTAELHDYIARTGEPYAPVALDFLGIGEDAIAVRPEPSPTVEQRDLTGARYGDFQFAIYCKSGSPEKATDQLYRYVEALNLSGFKLTDRTTITCEPMTGPHFVSQAEDKTVVYTASFHIEYHKE